MTSGRYLQNAAIASNLEARLNHSSILLAEAAKNNSERNVAFVWELIAQSIMYLLSCAAIVFTCISVSKRMRKMNEELEKTALIEIMPEQHVSLTSSDADDSNCRLVNSRDLTDIRIESANSAIRTKVRPLVKLVQFLIRFFVSRICSMVIVFCTRYAPSLKPRTVS